MKKAFLISMSLFFVIACNKTSEKKASLYDIKQVSSEEKADLEKRKIKIEKMGKGTLTKDQLDRKIQSIAYCEANKVPTIDSLPAVESEKDVKLRTKEEIVKRALALAYLGIKSEDAEKSDLDAFEKKYKITDLFTKKEKAYVLSSSPDEQQKIDANWRYESLHVLLWSLGYIDSLSYPSELCVVADDVKIIAGKTPEEFLAKAKLRSKKEILDQADLIYRLNWACVNARVKGEEAPSELNASVVYERHYALNWLTKYMNDDWDNINTDT